MAVRPQETNIELAAAELEDKPNSKFAQLLAPADVKGARTVSEQLRPVKIPDEQKEDYVKKDPKKTIRKLTDRLFVRKATFPVQDRTLRSYNVNQTRTIEQSVLLGEFYNQDDDAFWRVLGMRPRRTVGPCVEYDVPSEMEGIEFVMKLCDSDNPNAHLLFLQQFAFLREFREAFAGHPQRSHFPEYLGSGAFDQLCYKDNYAEDDAKIFMVLPRPHPRPYLLVERIGLTIEQLMRGNQFGLLDISTARFITIGCIQTLRLMHEMGWVHRCVANYTFALRVGSNGFMSDLDLNLNVVCVDAGFPRRFRSVNHPPRRVAPFAGTYKYSSIAAMENKEQMPNDDLISALYLFCEMIHGQLPWRGVHNLEKIMDMKKKLQDDPPIRIDNTGHREFPIDLRRLPQAFKLIENFNAFRIAEYIVYRDLYTIINVIAEINRHTITEEYVVVDKLKNVNKKFRNLTDAILDRGQPPAAVDQLQQQAKQQTPGTKGVHNQETQPAAQPPPVGVAKDKNHDPTATPTETRSGRSKKKQNQKIFPTTTTTNTKESGKEKQGQALTQQKATNSADQPPSRTK